MSSVEESEPRESDAIQLIDVAGGGEDDKHSATQDKVSVNSSSHPSPPRRELPRLPAKSANKINTPPSIAMADETEDSSDEATPGTENPETNGADISGELIEDQEEPTSPGKDEDDSPIRSAEISRKFVKSMRFVSGKVHAIGYGQKDIIQGDQAFKGDEDPNSPYHCIDKHLLCKIMLHSDIANLQHEKNFEKIYEAFKSHEDDDDDNKPADNNNPSHDHENHDEEYGLPLEEVFIQPEEGFVILTRRKNPLAKVYINVCYHNALGKHTGHTPEALDPIIKSLLSRHPEDPPCTLPFVLGTVHREYVEKMAVIRVDFVVHTKIVSAIDVHGETYKENLAAEVIKQLIALKVPIGPDFAIVKDKTYMRACDQIGNTPTSSAPSIQRQLSRGVSVDSRSLTRNVSGKYSSLTATKSPETAAVLDGETQQYPVRSIRVGENKFVEFTDSISDHINPPVVINIPEFDKVYCSPVFLGSFYKQGYKVKDQWKKRYFFMTDALLQYFDPNGHYQRDFNVEDCVLDNIWNTEKEDVRDHVPQNTFPFAVRNLTTGLHMYCFSPYEDVVQQLYGVITITQHCMDSIKTILNIPKSISGVMKKRGHLRRNWKARYFVLSYGLLKYYDNSDKSKLDETKDFGVLKGCILLKGAEVVAVNVKKDKDAPVTALRIRITIPSKRYELLLEIDDKEQQRIWALAIRDHINYANTHA